MKQMMQLLEASKMTSDGSVAAVFSLNLGAVVTACYERHEIEEMDEEFLRESLAERLKEFLSQIDVGEAIDCLQIIEMRDGETDKGIAIPGPMPQDEIPRGTMGKLVTLDGVEIQGTLESIRGVAGVIGAVRLEDGSLNFENDGETKIWWDEQKTLETTDGEIIFITESGHEVPASQVKLVAADD